MAVVREKNKNTWESFFYYTNYTGDKQRKHKRGFKTKKEAQEWEREFLSKTEFNTDMTFNSLYELYIDDLSYRLRENTLTTKKYIFKTKILPFFEKLKLEDITPLKIRQWQNSIMTSITQNNAPPSQTYLKTMNNQLVAIFNYAVKYHNLKFNPCHKAGSIGKKKANEMNIWTVEEFEKFVPFVKQKPLNYVGFHVLFWCGLRIGELLALTVGDVDLDNKTLNINKSYQRLNGRDVITPPKTPKSKRVIDISDNLVTLLDEYISKLYKPKKSTRLFESTKYAFEHDIRFYSERAGVKRIRLHDLRHSHTSFLFNNDVNIMVIANRLGHEKIQTTLDIYTHLYQSTNDKLISILNRKNEKEK